MCLFSCLRWTDATEGSTVQLLRCMQTQILLKLRSTGDRATVNMSLQDSQGYHSQIRELSHR